MGGNRTGLAQAKRYLPTPILPEASAWEEKAPVVRHESSGLAYEQAPYRYQVKCLAELRKKFAGLSPAAREELAPLLERTSCAPYLA